MSVRETGGGAEGVSECVKKKEGGGAEGVRKGERESAR